MARRGEHKPREQQQIESAQKQRRVIEMRLAGKDFRTIADELGYAGPSGAHKAYRTALREIIREPAEEVVTLELSRLDQLFAAHWDKALKGDGHATSHCLNIMFRRAKLLGIDAPTRINVQTIVQRTAEQFGLDPNEAAELHRSVQEFMATAKAGTE